ncbi:hypothetical protein EYF80_000627 [Liparis tanakae]|uniref:Uncharacterized protein n=1 Tax=Liparis tanakae TaxID=230148 RepID=A0A4Z2JGE6_9TELE|nr:hypothetical protein EYF80_000627 [Liparis tanakae]
MGTRQAEEEEEEEEEVEEKEEKEEEEEEETNKHIWRQEEMISLVNLASRSPSSCALSPTGLAHLVHHHLSDIPQSEHDFIALAKTRTLQEIRAYPAIRLGESWPVEQVHMFGLEQKPSPHEFLQIAGERNGRKRKGD